MTTLGKGQEICILEELENVRKYANDAITPEAI